MIVCHCDLLTNFGVTVSCPHFWVAKKVSVSQLHHLKT